MFPGVRLARIFSIGRLAILLGIPVPAAQIHAVSFDLVYDDDPDAVIDTDSIVGTGTVRYDGPATPGSFTLASLSGFTFDATIRGITFTTADLQTDLSLSGISVFSLAGGGFGLVFTGSGGTFGGSIEFATGGVLLSHEPTLAIGDGIGCCGGDGTVNRFRMLGGVNLGDYAATAIPEPGTAALLAFGLLGLATAQRRAIRRP